MERTPIAQLKQIKKHFNTVKANDGVDLSIYEGEIHAILGENGSGKSTLMNILSGLYAPDSGEILLYGKPITIASPKEAAENGIGMIHQHFKLVDALTVWENIIAGMPGGVFLQKKKVIAGIEKLCEKYHLVLNPLKKVYQMTIGEKQTVEIVKALYRGARIMILDEPTAVLTTQETEKLFDILREMKADHCAVLIITHKLHEVMEISDRVTVLRKGKSTASKLTSETNAQQLAELMVGKNVDLTVPFVETDFAKRTPVLAIDHLFVGEKNRNTRLDIAHLELYSYEILGIAGVADSGQKELCEAITGIQKASGSVRLFGTEIIGMNPRKMLEKNIQIGFIPEDRLGMGLAEGLSISDNVALRSFRNTKGPLLHMKEDTARAEKLVSEYNVSTPGISEEIQNLSGGNIQKILLGREISRGASLLIAAYPVRGLDIAAADFIYEKLNEEKKKGVSILFIGEDLDVLLALCDRIAVLHSGRLMAVTDAKTVTKDQLGLLMMGQEVNISGSN